MSYFSVQLQTAEGASVRRISVREAQELIDKGDAIRVKRKARQPFETVRLVRRPDPSQSPNSIPGLTCEDTETLAGAREASPSALQALRAKQLHFHPLQFPVLYA